MGSTSPSRHVSPPSRQAASDVGCKLADPADPLVTNFEYSCTCPSECLQGSGSEDSLLRTFDG